MIRLIKSDGVEFLLNIDLIQTIEEGKDTVITLTTGEKLAVKNSERDIMQKIRAHRQGVAEEKSESNS